MLFQGIPRPLRAPIEWSFIYDIPRYSMLFQGIPRPLQALIEWSFIWYSAMFRAIPRHSQTLAGTDWEEFYMVFHDTPCYSKAFPDPCGHQLSGVLCDIPLYSMLFQGIPRPLRAPIEWIFMWYSTMFYAIPRHSHTLAGVDLYIRFHNIPCFANASPLRFLCFPGVSWHFPVLFCAFPVFSESGGSVMNIPEKLVGVTAAPLFFTDDLFCS